jgi:hypothetical protein
METPLEWITIKLMVYYVITIKVTIYKDIILFFEML